MSKIPESMWKTSAGRRIQRREVNMVQSPPLSKRREMLISFSYVWLDHHRSQQTAKLFQ